MLISLYYSIVFIQYCCKCIFFTECILPYSFSIRLTLYIYYSIVFILVLSNLWHTNL